MIYYLLQHLQTYREIWIEQEHQDRQVALYNRLLFLVQHLIRQ